MKTKFMRFESEYDYEGTQIVFISAESKLNMWLSENPSVELVKWQACSIGASNSLCILIEYYDRK